MYYRKKDGTNLVPVMTEELIDRLENGEFDIEDIDARKKLDLYKKRQSFISKFKAQIQSKQKAFSDKTGIKPTSLSEYHDNKIKLLSDIASKL